MIQTSKNTCFSIVLISIWTLLQTLIHMFLISCAYLLSMCRIKATYYDLVFVYLTYFYKKSCGPINMKNETMFLNRTPPPRDNQTILRYYDLVAPKELYDFLREVLDRAELPHQSTGVSRTELYLVIIFISDVVWIFATVGLSVGACCKTKKKYLSIIFYGPWLLCSAFVNFLDVVSSVQHGLDLIHIYSYTSWLHFIGVTNPQDFVTFDQQPNSGVIPVFPTSVVVSILSRFFLVWLINVICFFSVLFLAIPDMAPRSRAHRDRRLRHNRNEPDSSEARINNWLQFYGEIGADNLMASGRSTPRLGAARPEHSLSTNEEAFRREVGFNCDAPEKGAMQAQSSLDQYSDPSYSKALVECSNSGYRRFSDVASGICFEPASDAEFKVDVLKSHMPWSYISPKMAQRFPRSSPAETKTDDSFKVQCTRL